MINLVGSYNLSATDTPGACVTIVAKCTIKLTSFNMSAPDIRIHAGIDIDAFNAKTTLYTPDPLSENTFALMIDDSSVVSATGKSSKTMQSGQTMGGSYASNGGSDASLTIDT